MSFAATLVERLLMWLARRTPATRLRLGRALGAIAWITVRRRRRVALRNLELCFPQLTAAERRQMARAHFTALAQSVIDRGVLWYGSEAQIRALVQLEGFAHLEAALTQGPVILLAPHFTGLDAGGTRMSLEGPAVSMYQVQSDPGFDALFRRGRTRFNDIRLISRRDGIRGMLRHMQAGLPVYYLPDMDFGARGAVFAPFFGVPAATLTAPAQLARNWQAQLLPVLTYWDPASGIYLTRILPPLPTLASDADLADATLSLNRAIEDWVRACPSQYHWVHKRFKTRPPGEPDLYDSMR